MTDHNCYGAELSETAAPAFKNVFIVYPIDNIPSKLKENEFIGVQEEELNLLIRPEFKRLIPKMVVLQPVTFSTKKEYNLHRILRAIDNNILLSKLAEQDVCKKSEYFKSEDLIIGAFQRYPEIIKNTKKSCMPVVLNLILKKLRTNNTILNPKNPM